MFTLCAFAAKRRGQIAEARVSSITKEEAIFDSLPEITVKEVGNRLLIRKK